MEFYRITKRVSEMKLWMAYLTVAVISMVLSHWFLHGMPAGIAALFFIVFAVMFILRLLMGKNIKKADQWR
jgi:uncharacterized membrane protein YtjA (UPF0391 family)